MDLKNETLDQLVEALLKSSKYKGISQDLIRSIGLQELAKRSNLKETIKSTKNKLHQVGEIYLDKVQYAQWLDQLRQSEKGHFVGICKEIMGYHASTRERLPIIDQFYSVVLADLPPIRSVLDLACGFNPLAIPLMGFPENEPVTYYAYDIFEDMINFLNDFLSIIQVHGYAQSCDIIRACPTQKVDIAFVLKAIPCLEQIDKRVGARLLQSINADHILVSFPVQSLSGHNKGMILNYETRFRELVANTSWSVKRFELATELVFRITT